MYYSFGNIRLLSAIVKLACHSKILKSFKEHTARGYMNRKQKLIWTCAYMPFWTVFISCCLIILNYGPCKYLNIFLMLFWNVLPVYICIVHINMNIKTPIVLRRTNPTPACCLLLVHFHISKLAFSRTPDWHSAVFCNLLVLLLL